MSPITKIYLKKTYFYNLSRSDKKNMFKCSAAIKMEL